MKNNTSSKYSRTILTVVTMRYYGHSNSDITEVTGLSKPFIVSHIKDWNAHGMEAINDNPGGSDTMLEPELMDM